MVRPGIMLYGSNPCRHETIELRPAMSLQTRVVNILNVQRGETVGYGRVYMQGTKVLSGVCYLDLLSE